MTFQEELLGGRAETEKLVKKAHRSGWWVTLEQLWAVPLLPGMAAIIIQGAIMQGRSLSIGIAILALGVAVEVAVAVTNPFLARRRAKNADIEKLRILPTALRRPELFKFEIFLKDPFKEYLPWIAGQLHKPATTPNYYAVARGEALVKNGFSGTLADAAELLGSWRAVEGWVKASNSKADAASGAEEFRSGLELARTLVANLPESLKSSTEAALDRAEERHDEIRHNLLLARGAEQTEVAGALMRELDELKLEVKNMNLLLAQESAEILKLRDTNESLAHFKQALMDLA